MSATVREWMNRKQASEYLHTLGCPLAPATLAGYAANKNRGRGPAFTRAGKIVRYQSRDLKTWAEAHTERVE